MGRDSPKSQSRLSTNVPSDLKGLGEENWYRKLTRTPVEFERTRLGGMATRAYQLTKLHYSTNLNV